SAEHHPRSCMRVRWIVVPHFRPAVGKRTVTDQYRLSASQLTGCPAGEIHRLWRSHQHEVHVDLFVDKDPVHLSCRDQALYLGVEGSRSEERRVGTESWYRWSG